VKTKKFVITAFVAVFLVVAVIGMYLYTASSQSQIKFTLLFGSHKNLDKKSQKPESPFSNYTVPEDNLSPKTTLKYKVDKIQCVIPVGSKPSFIGDVQIPGLKEDATSENDYWMLSAIQPIVLDYFDYEDMHYMVGALTDTDNKNCNKVVFVISGKFNVDDKSGNIKDDMAYVEESYVTWEEYKLKYPVGSQFKAFILTKRPESEMLVDDLCNMRPPASQRYCAIQRVTESFTQNAIDPTNMGNLFKISNNYEPVFIVTSQGVKN
jgi:hypothetical protein